MKSRNMKCIMVIALFAVISSMLLAGCTPDPFMEAIDPHVKEAISELKLLYELDRLDYQIEIKEEISDRYATGDIIFISDDIVGLEPEDQYELMRTVGTAFFEKLGTQISFDGYKLNVMHGTGYSVWLTSNGDKYIASYKDLSRNFTNIYDNPKFEEEFEEANGFSYDSWIEAGQKYSSEQKYKSVSSKDDDYWYAVTAAQNLVKDELRSPSTAKFPIDTSYKVKRSGSDWIVEGYVDAQNGFGATVRQYWKATFTMGDTSGSTYKVSNYKVTFS